MQNSIRTLDYRKGNMDWRKYEVQGHGNDRGTENNWSYKYAGDDTQTETIAEAKEYIKFLVNKAFPDSDYDDWRIVDIETGNVVE